MVKIFLNPYCNYGTGRQRWEKVSKVVGEIVGNSDIIEIESTDKIISHLKKARNENIRNIVAAGGDGTVNILLNALMSPELEHCEFTLGAVGLGSSNDYHKPFCPDAFIDDTPIHLDFANATRRDVLKVQFMDNNSSMQTNFCLLNASIGITAEANAFFNMRSPLIKMLQRISLEAAIMATALRTIIIFQNIPCRLKVDQEEEKYFKITNLGMIKNPHFTGSLCYDTPIELDDGEIGVNLCADLSLIERLAMLVALHRHRFQGRPKTFCWRATNLMIKSEKSFALEMDGEVVLTKYARLSILSKKLRCCS